MKCVEYEVPGVVTCGVPQQEFGAKDPFLDLNELFFRLHFTCDIEVSRMCTDAAEQFGVISCSKYIDHFGAMQP